MAILYSIFVAFYPIFYVATTVPKHEAMCSLYTYIDTGCGRVELFPWDWVILVHNRFHRKRWKKIGLLKFSPNTGTPETKKLIV